MRTSVVRVAEDYTKRKNVLRVSAVQPYRSEFLLQTETTEDFADWVKTLQEQVAACTDAELVGPLFNIQLRFYRIDLEVVQLFSVHRNIHYKINVH